MNIKQHKRIAVMLGLTVAACIGVVLYYIKQERGDGTFIPTQFFGYFTVQTAVLFAVVTVLYMMHIVTPFMQFARFCVTLYAIIILPIYWLVVAPPGTWEFTNGWVVIHLVLPVVAFVAWCVDRSNKIPMRWWWPLAALLYPMAYAIVSIARGKLFHDHWYPYEFLNYQQVGWDTTGKWIGVMLVGSLVVGCVLCLIARIRCRKS